MEKLTTSRSPFYSYKIWVLERGSNLPHGHTARKQQAHQDQTQAICCPGLCLNHSEVLLPSVCSPALFFFFYCSLHLSQASLLHFHLPPAPDGFSVHWLPAQLFTLIILSLCICLTARWGGPSKCCLLLSPTTYLRTSWAQVVLLDVFPWRRG